MTVCCYELDHGVTSICFTFCERRKVSQHYSHLAAFPFMLQKRLAEKFTGISGAELAKIRKSGQNLDEIYEKELFVYPWRE